MLTETEVEQRFEELLEQGAPFSGVSSCVDKEKNLHFPFVDIDKLTEKRLPKLKARCQELVDKYEIGEIHYLISSKGKGHLIVGSLCTLRTTLTIQKFLRDDNKHRRFTKYMGHSTLRVSPKNGQVPKYMGILVESPHTHPSFRLWIENYKRILKVETNGN